MRAIQKTGEGTYLSAGIFTYVFIWIFIIAWVGACLIVLLTVGIVVYVLGVVIVLMRSGKPGLHRWNFGWARLLRRVSGQTDEPEPAQVEEPEPDYLYHDDGIRMV